VLLSAVLTDTLHAALQDRVDWIEGGAIDVDPESERGERIKDIPTLEVA
jgi:hypothetical protein